MKLILDKCAGFLTPNTIIYQRGRTAFLAYCLYGNISVEGLSLLLSRGADVHSRTARGETCLHLVINARLDVELPDDIRDALSSLVQAGTDVLAIDSEGRSVSEIAYKKESLCFGDVWDMVLADNGYDVASFRVVSPEGSLSGLGLGDFPGGIHKSCV